MFEVVVHGRSGSGAEYRSISFAVVIINGDNSAMSNDGSHGIDTSDGCVRMDHSRKKNEEVGRALVSAVERMPSPRAALDRGPK
jgi:hypothetical protein